MKKEKEVGSIGSSYEAVCAPVPSWNHARPCGGYEFKLSLATNTYKQLLYARHCAEDQGYRHE